LGNDGDDGYCDSIVWTFMRTTWSSTASSSINIYDNLETKNVRNKLRRTTCISDLSMCIHLWCNQDDQINYKRI
jgi:hypothetical protein